jgi:hypothetical protein
VPDPGLILKYLAEFSSKSTMRRHNGEICNMNDNEPIIVPEVGDDEHLIRRLGRAVVRQWPSLPQDIRERIKQKAVFTRLPGNQPETAGLVEQISTFIKNHNQPRSQ